MELKKDYTIVIVTHNMQQASPYFGRDRLLPAGRSGGIRRTPSSLFSMPKDKRTEDYITGRFG